MIRRKRKTRKYSLLFFIILISVTVWSYSSEIKDVFLHINTNDVLAESSLKERDFSAVVKNIEVDELNAYIMEDHSNSLVSISFLFKGAGNAYIQDGKEGIANIVADLLTSGAGEYTEIEFKELCEEYGIKIGFSVSMDDFSGFIMFPSANINVATKLLKAVLLETHFDENYIDLTKKQMYVALDLQKERPDSVLANQFKKFIFKDHPYSRNSIGQMNDIEKIEEMDLRQYVENYLTQSNLLIGIAGDISESDAKSFISETFGNLSKGSKYSKLPKFDFISKIENYHITRDMPQIITRIVSKGTYRNNLDFYPLYLANYIFGEAGLSSRLSKAIREKAGLTYGIYTYLNISDSKALIEGSFSVTPDNLDNAIDLLKREWKKMAKDGVSIEELKQAKSSLISSFNLRFASVNSISDMLVSMQKFNLGQDFLNRRNDYIADVTLKEVNAAAKKYFNTIPTFVSIGNHKSEVK